MYICPMHSKELLKGTVRPIVMKLLAENGRMYGYEITQRVRQLSDEEIQLTEGALYPLLHKLEADGLVTTERERVGGRLRKYYRLSPQGETSAAEKLSELRSFLATIQRIIEPKTDPA